MTDHVGDGEASARATGGFAGSCGRNGMMVQLDGEVCLIHATGSDAPNEPPMAGHCDEDEHHAHAYQPAEPEERAPPGDMNGLRERLEIGEELAQSLRFGA